MLKIYQSNKLEYLKKNLCKKLISIKYKNILEKKIFLIDNYYMKNWLNINISNELNISANIQYMLQKTFFINFIKKNQRFNNNFLFNKRYLIWNLMSILNDKKNEKFFKNTNILSKKFQFCTYLIDLFIKYIYLKPEWIYQWENEKKSSKIKKSHIWYKNIWNLLMKNIGKNNFTKTIYSFFLLINKTNKIKKKIPTQIFIFSSKKINSFNYFIMSIIKNYTSIYHYQYIFNNKTSYKNENNLKLFFKKNNMLNYYNIYKNKNIKKEIKKYKNICILNQLKNDIFYLNYIKRNKKKILIN